MLGRKAVLEILFLLHSHRNVQITIRYDTIEKFNVDSKAENSALSSTCSRKLKQTKQCPFNSEQVDDLLVCFKSLTYATYCKDVQKYTQKRFD